MDRTPQGCDDLATDPLPFVRGLYQLIPEHRLAAILSRTARSSERRRRLPADSVIWLVIAMALFAADSIPKVWRRLHPTRDRPRADRLGLLPGATPARRRAAAAPVPGDRPPHGHAPDHRGLLPRLAADGPRRHHARPARHPGERPHLRPAHHRAGRGGLPPGPAAGPLRVGHARRLRPGDQAAVPRRAVDGRPAARPPRARACS